MKTLFDNNMKTLFDSNNQLRHMKTLFDKRIIAAGLTVKVKTAPKFLSIVVLWIRYNCMIILMNQITEIFSTW